MRACAHVGHLKCESRKFAVNNRTILRNPRKPLYHSVSHLTAHEKWYLWHAKTYNYTTNPKLLIIWPL